MHLPTGSLFQKYLTQHRHITIVVILLLCWTDVKFVESAGRVPVPVTVNKCCRIGEHIEQSESQPCMIGGPEKWVPRVFMAARAKYFEPYGEAPRFFTFKERSRPATCRQPELVLNDNKLAIFSNGSLFYSAKALFIDPDDYCIENDLALICYPEVHGADPLMAPAKKLSTVRKCCPQKSVYDVKQANCVRVTEDHPVFDRNVVNSSVVDILYTFPKCSNELPEYTIAGKFNHDKFDETNGTVKLDNGKTFWPVDYCLEHTVDDLQVNVNIFACAEQFSQPKSVLIKEKVSIFGYFVFHFYNAKIYRRATEAYKI